MLRGTRIKQIRVNLSSRNYKVLLILFDQSRNHSLQEWFTLNSPQDGGVLDEILDDPKEMNQNGFGKEVDFNL